MLDAVADAPAVDSARICEAAAAIMDDVPFFGRMASTARERAQMLDTLAAVPVPGPVATFLTVAHELQQEIWLDLVRTALTAVWLARTPALARCEPVHAAAAGLLHDIGMLPLDPQMMDPDHVLTGSQRRQLYTHPQVAAAWIRQSGAYPEAVLRAVAEHHECADGSGYPRGLAGDAISPLGRILSLAQVVAAMFAPGRSSPEMRLSVLLRMTWHRYDNAMGMQVLSLLKPHLDVMSADLRLMEDPITHLIEIDRLLRQWPMSLDKGAPLTPERVRVMEQMAGHAQQMRRVLAGVGAVPEQLALLAGEEQDDALRAELTLLTGEALWQLRTLARQTRRGWQLQETETLPAALGTWLDGVDRLHAEV